MIRWIFITLSALAAVVDALLIGYWRSGHADSIAGQQIVLILVLPFLLVAVLYGIYQGVKEWQKRRDNQKARLAQITESQSGLPIHDPDIPWVNVHYARLYSATGEDSGRTIEQIRSKELSPSDPNLFDDKKCHPRSRRIDQLDTASPHADDPLGDSAIDTHLTERGKRIIQLFRLLQPQLNDTIALIQSKRKQNQIMTRPVISQQAILHPAWLGQNFNTNLASDLTSSLAEQSDASLKYWYNVTLTVHILISEHLPVVDQACIQSMIAAWRSDSTNDVEPEYHTLSDSDACVRFLIDSTHGLTQEQRPTLMLILGADSTIDQTWLNEQMRGYTAGEVGFALLLGSPTTAQLADDLPISAYISTPVAQHLDQSLSRKKQQHIALDLWQNIGQTYKTVPEHLLSEDSILFSDARSSDEAQQAELATIIRKYDIDSKQQMAMAGTVLEDADTLSPAMTLTLAAAYGKEAAECLPVICHSGQIERAIWLVRPTSLTQQTEQPVAKQLDGT